MGEDEQEARTRRLNTCVSLELDLTAAEAGQPERLLPRRYRDIELGKTYPLPSRISELRKLVIIPVPPFRKDAGSEYMRRAAARYKELLSRKQSALLDIGARAEQARLAQKSFDKSLESMQAEAKSAVDGVRTEINRAIASLSDLFRLGREGLEGQMKAHLANEPWKGEVIDADAFRQCFRMVSQTVKALGVPTEQSDKAKEAIIEEAAKALQETREALAMSPNAIPETKH